MYYAWHWLYHLHKGDLLIIIVGLGHWVLKTLPKVPLTLSPEFSGEQVRWLGFLPVLTGLWLFFVACGSTGAQETHVTGSLVNVLYVASRQILKAVQWAVCSELYCSLHVC